MFDWILNHIEFIIAGIATPTLAWLFYDRHKNKITLDTMAKELEAKDVAIESDKFSSMQKQIEVFESLIENLHKHSEKMQEIYKQDINDLEERIEKMRAAHDEERAKYMEQVISLQKEVSQLKYELEKERKNACKQ